MIRSFRDLLVWQKAKAFAVEVYRVTKGFPGDERFGLTSQLRRAVVSVSSNIAEGHARQGNEFRHLLSIARGSLAESESQIEVSIELGYVTPDDLRLAFEMAEELRRMLASPEAKVRHSQLTPDP